MNEESPHKYKLSVITATYNAMAHLPNLIECLRNQEDKDFEWVVADGASTDGTLELLQSIDDLNLVITSQEDFGIYDALNRGIKESSGEFYLVMGADDLLYPNGIKDYKDAIGAEVDIVTGWIDTAEGVARPRGKSLWLNGFSCYVSGHSVGAVFRKSLHERVGYYSNKLPIVADQLFVVQAVQSGGAVRTCNVKVGRYGDTGVSARDIAGMISEYYRFQLAVGGGKFLQTVLYVIRLVKNYRRL